MEDICPMGCKVMEERGLEEDEVNGWLEVGWRWEGGLVLPPWDLENGWWRRSIF